jgi:thiamine pyrophosphokinase
MEKNHETTQTMNKDSFAKQVIIGNGDFPQHAIPLWILEQAETIICCDGAADSLLERGITPTVVIGDLDSISAKAKKAFAHILLHNADDATNDQTKAVQWAKSQGIRNLVILGACGKREDHTLGNISLLGEYGKDISICMCTDYGVFTPIYRTTTFESYAGQQVSIFCITPHTTLTSNQLKYPLQQVSFDSWWKGTLNESCGTSFTLDFKEGTVIVFREHKL